jgi:hypothetical protein
MCTARNSNGARHNLLGSLKIVRYAAAVSDNDYIVHIGLAVLQVSLETGYISVTREGALSSSKGNSVLRCTLTAGFSFFGNFGVAPGGQRTHLFHFNAFGILVWN